MTPGQLFHHVDAATAIHEARMKSFEPGDAGPGLDRRSIVLRPDRPPHYSVGQPRRTP